MRKYVYRTLAIGLVLCMLLSLASVFAEPAVVSGSDVNVRSGPDSSYGVIDCLALNTAVEITDRSNSSWYQISYNGKTGYMYSVYLKNSDTGSGSSITIGGNTQSSVPSVSAPSVSGIPGTVNAMYVRFRSSPNTDSAILGTYNRGQKVTVTGAISNGWYPAVINGQNGYIYAQYVDVQAAPTPVATPVPSTAPEVPVATPVVAPSEGTEGYITGNDVMFRSGPGTNYAVRGAFNRGTKVTIKGQSNGWTSVILDGMDGYIFSQYISVGSPDGNASGNSNNTPAPEVTSAPVSTPAPVVTPVPTAAPVAIKAYITGNSVNFRSGPGSNYSIIGSYDVGKEVEYKGENNGWTSVVIDGREGYVFSQYINRVNPNNAPNSNGSSIPAATPAPVTTTKAYITGNEVNFRTGPGTNHQIITAFNRGTEVEFIDETGGWCHIRFNGSTGYVSSQYVNKAPSSSSSAVTPVQPTPSPVPTPQASVPTTPAPTQGGFIKGNSVRFRSGPSTAYEILGTYNYGKVLTIKNTVGEWIECTIDGRDGYVYSTYVAKDNVPNNGSGSGSGSANNTTPGQVPNNATGMDIVNFALQYVGYPYVWGGSSPAGFDCSGFVQYVYKNFNYQLKRVACDQATDGIFVQGDLQPGDVLCFYSGSDYIGHVGIYMGNGQFVHASNATTGVIISELSGYYTNRGYVARRIIY